MKIFSSTIEHVKAHRFIYEISFLTLLAGFLRFYHLGFQSFWCDEALSFYELGGPFKNYFRHSIDANPPLFFFIAKPFNFFFGRHEASLRLTATIFGILTIPIAYLITENLIGRSAAFWITLVWCCMPYHIYFSQEFRMYSLAAMESLLILYFWNCALEKNQLTDWLFWGIFSVAGLYTHHWFIFYVCSLMAWAWVAIIFTKSNPLWLAASVLLIVVIYVPSIPPLIHQFNTVTFYSTHRPLISHIGFTGRVFSGIQLGDTLNPGLNPWFGFSAIFLSLTLIVSGLLVSPKKQRTLRLFIGGWILPITLASAICAYVLPVYNSRYLIIFLPSFLLTIAPALEGQNNKRVWAMRFLTLLWMMSFIPFLSVYYSTNLKGPWKEIGAYISKKSDTESAIVLGNLEYWNHITVTYYNRLDIEMAQKFPDITPGKNIFWLVSSNDMGHPPTQPEIQKLWKKVPSQFFVKDEATFEHVRVVHLGVKIL